MAEDNRKERLMWQEADVELSQCVKCVHKRIGALCMAFPNGIPDEILSGKVDHKNPYPGDNGIRFELNS